MKTAGGAEAGGASSAPVEQVSRARSGARSEPWKAWGALQFGATGGVQTPEPPAIRPGWEKVAVAYSRDAAVHLPCSPPAVAVNEQGLRAIRVIKTTWR